MFNFNLQLFTHKKGTGSTRNGRDSESKRLGVKCHDGVIVKRQHHRSPAWYALPSGHERRHRQR